MYICMYVTKKWGFPYKYNIKLQIADTRICTSERVDLQGAKKKRKSFKCIFINYFKIDHAFEKYVPINELYHKFQLKTRSGKKNVVCIGDM